MKKTHLLLTHIPVDDDSRNGLTGEGIKAENHFCKMHAIEDNYF